MIRMSAIRKLAGEAADNGLIALELVAGIARVKSVKSTGVRVGNWLTLRQSQSLLSASDVATVKGLRDRAIIAVLLGCGLRRSQVFALTFAHAQQRDGRWCIVDLKGKHGRVRTMPTPTWVKVALDSWTSTGITEGSVFRPVNRERATLRGMGIDFHTATGEMKPTSEILTEISEGLNKLPEGLQRDAAVGENVQETGRAARCHRQEFVHNLRRRLHPFCDGSLIPWCQTHSGSRVISLGL
jgi:integrase